jgi:hypothetical protein
MIHKSNSKMLNCHRTWQEGLLTLKPRHMPSSITKHRIVKKGKARCWSAAPGSDGLLMLKPRHVPISLTQHKVQQRIRNMLNCRTWQEWAADAEAPPHVKLNHQTQKGKKER